LYSGGRRHKFQHWFVTHNTVSTNLLFIYAVSLLHKYVISGSVLLHTYKTMAGKQVAFKLQLL